MCLSPDPPFRSEGSISRSTAQVKDLGWIHGVFSLRPVGQRMSRTISYSQLGCECMG